VPSWYFALHGTCGEPYPVDNLYFINVWTDPLVPGTYDLTPGESQQGTGCQCGIGPEPVQAGTVTIETVSPTEVSGHLDARLLHGEWHENFTLTVCQAERPQTCFACTGTGESAECNELLATSSFAGACVSGNCQCHSGFELSPAGRCQPLGAACTDRDALSCNDKAGNSSVAAGSCVGGSCSCNEGFITNAVTHHCRRPLVVDSVSTLQPFEGTTLTVLGANFTSTTQVVIRGIVAQSTSFMPTQLGVVVPDYADIVPGAPVPADFEVQDPGMPSVPVADFFIRGR
jgi:hypothetical protein